MHHAFFPIRKQEIFLFACHSPVTFNTSRQLLASNLLPCRLLIETRQHVISKAKPAPKAGRIDKNYAAVFEKEKLLS
jgi:hypothetical protein